MGASGLWGVRTSRGVWVACSGGVDAGAAGAMAVEAVSGASEAEAEAAAMVAAVRAMAAVAAAMAAARVAIVAVAVAAMAAAAVVVVVATAAAVMGEMAMAGMALMAEQAQHSQKAQAHSPLRIQNLSWSVSESCERARATRRPRRCAGLARGAKKMRNKRLSQKRLNRRVVLGFFTTIGDGV